MRHFRFLLPLLIVTLLSLTGCGGDKTTVTTTTTMGQELQDLDKSYKDGLINESEYKKAKKAILKRYE